MSGAPQKQKWAAATITKQTQKLARKQETSDNQIFFFLFPLIPTRATTTKLVQKLENIQTNQNHVQPGGCWEGIFLKILFWFFLILSDYV